MSTSMEAPPVDQLTAELVATLCMAGLTYLAKDDVESAVVACDVAGPAFERISTTLRPEERTSLGELVSALRMEIVRKRGP